MVTTVQARWLGVLFLLGICAYLILNFMNSLWSGSVDIALHYALITRITEYWQLPATFDPSLGPMNTYPNYSHILAAILGTLFGSPFAGMQFVALASLAGLWSGFALMFFSLPRRALWIVSVALAVLFSVNWFFVHLEIFGHELLGNFFFAQLAAQAAAVVILAFIMFVERAGIHPIFGHLILACSVPIIQHFHLMPALQLFATWGLLIAWNSWAAHKGDRVKTLLPGLLAMIVSLLLLVVDPAFQIMVKISEHNGSMGLAYTPTRLALAIECVIVIILSSFLLIQWWRLGSARKNGILLKYMSLYSISIAGLCLLQIIILKLGVGSEYAIKKYGFALNTSLLLELPLLLVVLFKSYLINIEESPDHPATLYRYAFPGLFVFLAFFTVLPSSKVIAATDIISIERFALQYRNLGLESLPDKYDYGIGLFEIPTFDYLISIGILKAPQSTNAYNILESKMPQEPDLIGRIFTRQGSLGWDVPECREYVTPGGLVILDGACVLSKVNIVQTMCSGTVDFTDRGYLYPFDITGFSTPWAGGNWSVGNIASFRCKLPTEGAMPTKVLISGFGLVSEDYRQRMLVSINGAPSEEVLFTTDGELVTAELDINAQYETTLEFSFLFPDAISPRDLGINDDNRMLGVAIRTIEFK